MPEGEKIFNGINGNAIANDNGVANSNSFANGSCNTNHPSSYHNVVISLDRGDPKVYYPFWKTVDDKCEVTIKAWEFMSYFGDYNEVGVFYQLPEFSEAVHRVHRVVGNAVTEGRYIIGGTGSSQLFNFAVRALASTIDNTNDLTKKLIPVVCERPYYSCYEESLLEENSGVYQWQGDAKSFVADGPYIEVVTSPNNPDGRIREPVVKKEGGLLICDLAYYWPQYTPITAPADYDIMLFTLSKATGHAGSRVGWAIVKDKQIADKMTKLMALFTIGMCHEGQFRASKILNFVADSYKNLDNGKPVVEQPPEGLFEFGNRVLSDRWAKLRAAIKNCGAFNLPDYSPQYCNFLKKSNYPNPAYAWLELKTGENAETMLNKNNIVTRGGTRFGSSSKYTRVSLLESDDAFNKFLERLSNLQN